MHGSTVVKRWLVCLGGALALLVLAGISAVLVVSQTAWGRARVADYVASSLSSALPGSVEIDRVQWIDGSQAQVRGLRFYAPGGELVLGLQRVRIDVALSALWSREFRLSSAEATAGELVIAHGPEGSMPLVDAFSAPSPHPQDTEPSASGRERWRLALHGIRVDNLRLRLALSDLDPMVLRVDQALVRVDLSRNGTVDVRFSQVKGRSIQLPLDLPQTYLRGVHGRYRGGLDTPLRIEGPIALEDDEVELRLRYHEQGEPLDLHLQGVAQDRLLVRALGALADPFGIDVQIN